MNMNNYETSRNIKQIQIALEMRKNYQIMKQTEESKLQEKSEILLDIDRLHISNINKENLFLNSYKNSYPVSVKTMGLQKLKEISLKEPLKILITLNSPESGFKELLETSNFDEEVMITILSILKKISEVTDITNLNSFIKLVLYETSFVKQYLYMYLTRFSHQNIDSVNNILQFLLKFQELQPVIATKILSSAIPILETIIEKIKEKEFCLSSIIKNMKILQMKNKQLMEKYEEALRLKIFDNKQIHLGKSPEDYKNIPIFPSKEDFINKQPFLHPNIIHGSYLDINHYLDIHFRLLREDYMRPLRKSIEIHIKETYNDKNEKIEFRIYDDVRVLCSYNTESGIVHLISFDVKPFSKLSWEESKRFLPRSLLCLSSDNFETMHLATVANRDPSMLRKGQLVVYFEKLEKDIFSITSSEIFVMVESHAYFEAYRHTLLVLQRIKDDELPMKKYIIHTQKEVSTPKYLNSSTKYNFSLTFRNLPSVINKYMVPVLNTNLWPSEKQLGLGHSQFSAIQAALTNEFAIIQGPPGTGKTFIGLKITQLLLENSIIWKDWYNSPILVVCYTNHALDQFLEGILSFETRIIRIGERSNSKIKPFQLKQIRQKARRNHNIPKYIYLERKNIMENIRIIQCYSESYFHLLEFITQEIMPIELLQRFMESRHAKFFENDPLFSLEKSYTISDWLSVSNYKELMNGKMENIVKDSNTSDMAINVKSEEYVESLLDLEVKDKSSRIIENRNKNSRKKINVNKQLDCVEVMTISEEKNISNIWELKIEDRWRLYRLWIARYINEMTECFSNLQKDFQEQIEKLKKLQTLENKYLLNGAKVIGITTTGASKYRELLEYLHPRIVIMEEAAEVLEAHTITSLAASTEHFILIRDHQQLRPTTTVYELAVSYSMDISLFERMIKNGMSYHQLTVQYRMRPCISRLLISTIYPNLKNHPCVKKYKNVLGVEKNMFFINHCYPEKYITDTKSYNNLHEAKFIVELCIFFKHQEYVSSQITVLTTYAEQLHLLKMLTKESRLLDGIQMTVIDDFQGEENDIVLISFVRSNDKGRIGFLNISNRICVALSRAKEGLFCIGNFDLFAEKSDLWKNIIEELRHQNAIGSALTLCCQNHPENITKVSTAEDFKRNAPNGGCTKWCKFMMKCGHLCMKNCHPYNREHRKMKCVNLCNKILCDYGHNCEKFCFESCGKCMVPVKKIIPICQHVNLVPCHVEAKYFFCKHICNKSLDCGHLCSKLCYKPCNPCIRKIEKTFDCGHKANLYCYQTNSAICNEVCERDLICGHKCYQDCGIIPCPPCKTLKKISLPCKHEIRIKCSQKFPTDFHFRCKQFCAKKLKCGHKCNLICGHLGNCGQCDKKCKNILRCGHCCNLKCINKCPDKCKNCVSILNVTNYLCKFKENSSMKF